MKKLIICCKCLLALTIALVSTKQLSGATKTAAANGNWSTNGTWSPSGVPATGDNVVIPNNRTVTITANASIANVTVSSGGTLNINSGKTLTMSQALTVNGTMTNNGVIAFASGKAFTIGSDGTFTWNPSTNTAAAATLFTNGVEDFSPTSILIINKWYDQANVPLGSVVTGNFGDLIFTMSNLTEWNQQNNFETHLIIGELTITYGWITLDKSGAISNTTIGNINLTTVNAYLSFHNGTHPGSFAVNTTDLTVTNGTVEGLLNGNGNLTLNVTGNCSVTAAGYLYLIINSGVAGVGNGDVSFNVAGNYVQSGNNSRFYGIYNASTTTAGNSTMNVGTNLSFSGGVFMLQYACHSGSGTTALNVVGNSTINYTNTSNIFRITGLTTLSSINSTSKMNFKCNGKLTFTGVAGEFTSSSTTGAETDTIVGDLTLSGGFCGFNWPDVSAGAHNTTLVVNGNYSATAGTMIFSVYGQALTASIAGNLTVSGGSTYVKYEAAPASLYVNGNYSQTAGNYYVIGGLPSSGTAGTSMDIAGNFSISGGTFNASAYPGASGTTGLAEVSLNNDFTFSGGTITETSTTVGRGRFRFIKSGTVTVTGGGTIANTIDFYIPNSGTTVNLATWVLTGSGDFIMWPSTGLMMGSTGGISISGATGNVQVTGTRSYGINSDYTYSGSSAQLTGNGLPAAVNNLTINNGSGVTLSQSVTVDALLTLSSGIVTTNLYEVNVTNNSTTAISGYTSNKYINGNLRRSTTSTGSYDFPVGTIANYEPLNMNLTGISGATNLLVAFINANPINPSYPLTGVTVNGTTITDILNYGYWTVMPDNPMSGGSYTVTVNEKGYTNGVANPQAYTVLTRNNPNASWSASNGVHANNTQSINGTVVTAKRSALTTEYNFGIGFTTGGTLPIKLKYFTAAPNGNTVDLSWATATEINNNFFTVERSADGKHFEKLLTKAGAGNSTTIQYYTASDKNPLNGTSYFRLKQTDYDGHFTYSKTESVNMNGRASGNEVLKINSISPNPFKENFRLQFNMNTALPVDLYIRNATGKEIVHEKMNTQEGINTYAFTDKYNLQKGVYFLEMIYNDQKVIQKIIKN